MACPHVNSTDLAPPRPNQPVYREDCTQCFDSVDDPEGLDVCLSCFNGGCTGERGHSRLHYETTHHPLAVNIRRKRKLANRNEPPQKMSKLAIAAETEQDKYDTSTRVHCFKCGVDEIDQNSGKLPELVNAVLKANTFAKQEEVKAWEQELVPCEHSLCLEQGDAREMPSQNLSQCARCDLKENLWLCLTCGNLGCGRAQFGGIGGNSHAKHHGAHTGHPVAVKLGSLTAEGNADVYCYVCDDERTDPELAAHLAHWGINIADRQKTEKSMTELQIDQNLRWEFSMTDEGGREMKPLFGAGFTGLKNLGNSCYLASTLQCLFDMPEFAQRYYRQDEAPPSAGSPAEDLETQLRKMADGLLSGRYSHPDSDVIASHDTEEVPHQKGLAPAMLKHLIGRGHSEFSTMRQQDAFELLLHLLQMIARSQHPYSTPDPVNTFKFVMEQKLQCLNCRKVRYRSDEMENISIPVPVRRCAPDLSKSETTSEEHKDEFEPVSLTECLDIFTSAETVEFTCPSCSSKAGFTKQSLFQTFPDVLAVNARRFDIVNWLPTKMDVPVVVGDAPISFDKYKSPGHQPGEELLPEDADVGGSSSKHGFVPNQVAMEQLQMMGFPEVRCKKALKATGNTDAETATAWLFEHMEDPDIDEAMQDDGSGDGNAFTADSESIEQLSAMGFGAPQARQALRETGGNMERAVDWLFSHPDAQGESDEPSSAQSSSNATKMPGSSELPVNFKLQSIVCHKGTSIHAGHYVAFIRKHIPETHTTDWVLFNDEKVAKAGSDLEDMKRFAYVYFFRRV